MTTSEPSPSDFDPDKDTNKGPLNWLETDEERNQQNLAVDSMLSRLLDIELPPACTIERLRERVQEASGIELTLTYLKDAVIVPPEEENYSEYKVTLHLAQSLKHLAAAKILQARLLEEAAAAKEEGKPKQAALSLADAQNVRKEAEASVLTDEVLGESFAEFLLDIASPEFQGESLLPMTDESWLYVEMYIVDREEAERDRVCRSTYRARAYEILRSYVTPAQMECSGYEDFARFLCWAVVHQLIAAQREPRDSMSHHRAVIQGFLQMAQNSASKIGVNPADVHAIYEGVVAEMMREI